jgi:hypothetical protein
MVANQQRTGMGGGQGTVACLAICADCQVALHVWAFVSGVVVTSAIQRAGARCFGVQCRCSCQVEAFASAAVHVVMQGMQCS